MNFIKLLFLLVFSLDISIVFAQEESTIGQMLDDLTYSWDNESETLETYDGLLAFCEDVTYRNNIIKLLNDIHHYDSVLYEKAVVASKKSSDKEILKLMKDLEDFEHKYSMKSLLHYLHDECSVEKNLEKNSKDLKTEVGGESYDSQIYILEVELQKYIKHITKRLDNIRKHIHHLGVK